MENNKKLNIRKMLILYDILAYVVINILLYKVYDPVAEKVFTSQLVISFVSIFLCRFIGKIYSQIWRYGGIQCYMRLLVTDGIAFVISMSINKAAFVYEEQVVFVRMLSFFCINLLASLAMRMIYRYAYKCGNNETAKGIFLNSLLKIFQDLIQRRQTTVERSRLP